jgi:ATP-dependent Zn protease
MKIARDEARWPIAVHEAGHAVIGRVVGMVCGDCSIMPDHNSSGNVIVGDPYKTWEVWEERGRYREFSTVMLGRVLTFMAGTAAETVVLGKCEGGNYDDLYQVACMLDDVYGEDRERIEGRLWAAAGRLVRRHREKIERVATELMARHPLTADDIDAIMEGA